MTKRSKVLTTDKQKKVPASYSRVLSDITNLLNTARQTVARSVNSTMTATYWGIGRRIVEAEQQGKHRADYGTMLIGKLSQDLTSNFGRGFGVVNLSQMRRFYLDWSLEKIFQTPSEKFDFAILTQHFPLSWSHYVELLSVKNNYARRFYESEALRGGWSVRQLDRQINSQFYERTALSRNKVAMLTKGVRPQAEDHVTPEEEIKNPYVLEFLNLKDEYSESELEEALIRHLETFLLELGSEFTFVARQKRLRVGDSWYRIDLVFYHRRLRSLVLIDLKIGKFSHADAGQMHLYLNYAKAHWTLSEENPPIGLILCTEKDAAVARYALEGLPNKVLTAEYRTVLPEEKTIELELKRTLKFIEARKLHRTSKSTSKPH